MTARLDYRAASPEAFRAMLALETQVHHLDIDPILKELIKVRVSQLNGCAYCLDMHTKDARAAGETELRLHLLAAWHEAPVYTPHERAGLAWAEAVTLLNRGSVSDAVYDEAKAAFGEKGLVDLTLAVIAINGWNRLAVPFRSVAGEYQPAAAAAD